MSKKEFPKGTEVRCFIKENADFISGYGTVVAVEGEIYVVALHVIGVEAVREVRWFYREELEITPSSPTN